eukprot:6318118-Prorocentrum_lima.AAC.1
MEPTVLLHQGLGWDVGGRRRARMAMESLRCRRASMTVHTGDSRRRSLYPSKQPGSKQPGHEDF